jgi:hypothetical protein
LPIPNRPGWEADTEGKVFSPAGREVGYYNNRGYVMVQMPHRKVKRAKLVCMAFHGLCPPGKDICAHRNDVKDDDRPESLYWATNSENTMDSYRNDRQYLRPAHMRDPRNHKCADAGY